MGQLALERAADRVSRLALPEPTARFEAQLLIAEAQLINILVGMTGPGLYDPTNIMNSDTLSKGEPFVYFSYQIKFNFQFFLAMKEGWIKLGVYLLSFFYYLYG